MLLALGLFLAAIHLGPETPLGPRVIGAAPNSQYSPAAAWNGHTGLAVWLDDRGRYPADSIPLRAYVEQTVRVSPMRADGSLVNPAGTPLFAASALRLASNGSSFMLAYADHNGTHAVPLDENGVVAGADTLIIASYSFDFDIVSNGHTFLFVSPMPNQSVEALVFAPDGAPYAAKTFDTHSFQNSAVAAAVIGDVYAIAYRSPELHLAFLAENAATTDQVIDSDPDAARGLLSMAASDDRVLIALTGLGDVRTMIVGRDGRTIAPMQPQFNSYHLFIEGPLPAFWDGTSFLITWLSDEGTMTAADISPTNSLIDLPAVIATREPRDLTFTRTSDGIVAMWFSDGDVLRRVFTSNKQLLAQPRTETPVVLDLQTQTEPSLAPFGSEPLRVWREGPRDVHIKLSIAGKTVDVAASTDRDLRDPSVARGGDVVLVFWRDILRPDPGALSTYGYRTYARRFALDGTPLDAQPILVESADAITNEIELGTSTVFDGRNFVVFWSTPNLRAARISPAGALLDATPLVIEATPALGFDSGMHAVRNGDEIVVAWSSWNDYRYLTGISPRPSPVSAADVARIDTRGSAMKVLETRALWQRAGLSKRTDIANDAVVSQHNGCIEATLLGSSTPVTIDCAAGVGRPAIAWDGEEYVVVWSRASDVRAMHLDRSLHPLDDSFSIAPPGAGAAYEPAVALAGSGVEVDYVRFDNGIPRLFARVLDRLGPITRGRVIGH